MEWNEWGEMNEKSEKKEDGYGMGGEEILSGIGNGIGWLDDGTWLLWGCLRWVMDQSGKRRRRRK
jgi:hypothetical protein